MERIIEKANARIVESMLYPLKFHPILKQKIWGGNKLETIFNKITDQNNVGESWEISTINDNISVVSNGIFEGKSLSELIFEYKSELLGKRIYQEFGDQFPLLVKFIDAKEDLSIQLHPSDELSKKRHNSFGKTEMWYVVQADEDANLILGFNKNTSKEEYSSYLENNKIEELLKEEPAKKGDSYFIDVGTIHAIGSGNLIAEIQQTSNITYRVYDWGRKDSQGNTRELHTDLALDALNYDYKEDYKQNYKSIENYPNEITSCSYFTTNYIKVTQTYKRSYDDIDSFKIYMCIEGNGNIKINKHLENVSKGDTLLVPAIYNEIEINGDQMELLEIYIK